MPAVDRFVTFCITQMKCRHFVLSFAFNSLENYHKISINLRDFFCSASTLITIRNNILLNEYLNIFICRGVLYELTLLSCFIVIILCYFIFIIRNSYHFIIKLQKVAFTDWRLLLVCLLHSFSFFYFTF